MAGPLCSDSFRFSDYWLSAGPNDMVGAENEVRFSYLTHSNLLCNEKFDFLREP